MNEVDTSLATSHLDALTPKQKALLDAMVWHGLSRPDAIQHAGISERQSWRIIGMPAFQRAMKKEMEVLRTSARPRAIKRLVELAEQDEARGAAVQAARFLASEHDDGMTVNVGVGVSVGYVLDLSHGTPKDAPVVDVVAGARNHMSTTGGPALGGRRTPPPFDPEVPE